VLALGYASLIVARLAHPALAKQPGRSLRLAAFGLARDALTRTILGARPSGQLRCSPALLARAVFASRKRSTSPAAHRRQKCDFIAIGKRMIPARKFAVDRDTQAFVTKHETVPLPQLFVQSARICERRGTLFAVASGGITQ
jgi:hypothetical protein